MVFSAAPYNLADQSLLRDYSLSLPLPLVLAQVELEFADVEHCRWAWRQYDPANPLPPTVFPESAATDKDRPVVDPKPRLPISDPIISTSFIYWTAEEDEGYKLVLECTPCNESGEEGEPVKVVSKNIVSRFWNIPMMQRHLMTPNHLAEPTQFRVVSYNILADVYATSERARSALYPYCDPSALDQDYRRCLIARELLGYHGDIVCLQEVGAKCFSQFLCPALHQWGYQACFHPKAGKTPEGEATFFNSSKFSLIQEDAVVLREFVNQSPNCRDILSLHPLILADLLERHNILQTVLLRSTEITNSYILAANTHLYFHPMGDHIRLLQVAISLKILGSKLREYQHKLGTDARFAVVFCGDFNSCPCTAAYSYLSSGSVGAGHPDWQLYRAAQPPQCSCNHRALNVIHEDIGGDQWAQPQSAQLQDRATGDFSTGLDLSQSFNFSNVCGTRHSTNVTLGWTGVIDYIFADSKWLETLRYVPFPAPEHLTEHVALPSINFPSDHVALVADLAFRTKQLQ